MNSKFRKLAFTACAGMAAAGMSGCASTQVASLAKADAAQAPEQMVSRALPSYGTMGGYRYRRFAAVAAAS